jgi:hypothetical protein
MSNLENSVLLVNLTFVLLVLELKFLVILEEMEIKEVINLLLVPDFSLLILEMVHMVLIFLTN